MPSREKTNRYGLLAVAILAVLVLLYSVLVMQRALYAVSFVLPLFLLYLVWRFVRAHERIADALEGREDNR